jgi:citrate lyase beta subunit
MRKKKPALSLGPAAARRLLGPVRRAGAAFARAYPGESGARQPVHTVYGGAQLFRSDSVPRLGMLALKAFAEHAPSAGAFAAAIGLSAPEGTSPADFAATVHARVKAKLEREPVEDYRIDFEDGYGNRPDAEEDSHAQGAAHEVSRAMKEGTLPPFAGIRVKPLSPELAERALRTLDLFVTTLVRETRRLPEGFVVTLPKVTMPEQVSVLVRALKALEARNRLERGALRLELMVETPQAILNGRGTAALPGLIAAAEGRCASAHFGTYDYTAACRITAAHQTMTHPACEFAKQVMQVVLAGTGVSLSDGATNVMPVGPHRTAPGGPPLTQEQQLRNRAAVHRAWQLHFEDVRSSLRNGYYQGWDLHPAQLVTRYAAVYSFFLEGLETASLRLRSFMEKAAQATLVGDVFDDAATGQGLLNYFLRGLMSGAITEDEARSTGLTLDELKTRSFLKILQARRAGP